MAWEFSEQDKFERQTTYLWLISADSIFKSGVAGFEDYSRFYGMEFSMFRASLFDGEKTSDSAISAQNIKIYIWPGIHCAMIQGRMAQKVVIPKISIKKVAEISGTLKVLEEKEFSKCIIHSFSRVFNDNREEITFTFSCLSFSDHYTKIKPGGEDGGKAAVEIDFAAWKIEEK